MQIKLKKYILITLFFFTMFIGINGVRAEQKKDCYYESPDGKTKIRLKILWDRDDILIPAVSQLSQVKVDKTGNEYVFDDEGIANWWKLGNLWSNCLTGGDCFGYVYNDFWDANNANSNHSCPKYLVWEYDSQYMVWATNDEAKAKRSEITGKQNNIPTFYVSNTKTNGQPVTKDEYFKEFIMEEIIISDASGELYCNELFSGETREIIDTILGYVRVLVPILVILLGTIDLAKATIAGKEDNMKKAQWDFAKRVAIGVAIFFVPLLVDVIMDLATIVWEGEGYVGCKL